MTPKSSALTVSSRRSRQMPPSSSQAHQRAIMATRWIRWILPILLILEAGLGIAYLWNIAQGHPIAWIDFNVRQTLPSFLQAAHILALAAICGWRLWRNPSPTPSRLVLRLLIFILTFGAIDEVFKLHLMSRTEFVSHAFFGVYLGLIVALPIVFWRDVKAVWQLERGSMLLAASGLAVFCLGVFAADWIRDGIVAPLWPLLSDRAGGVKYISIVIEEVSELWGETCLVLAALRFQWVTSHQPEQDL